MEERASEADPIDCDNSRASLWIRAVEIEFVRIKAIGKNCGQKKQQRVSDPRCRRLRLKLFTDFVPHKLQKQLSAALPKQHAV